MAQRIPPSAVGALGALALIWGYSWVMMKVGVQYSGPFAFSTLRCLTGGVILLLVQVVVQRRLLPSDPWGALILGLLQTTCFTGLSTWAIVSGGAGKTAVIVYTMPLWIILLSWPLLGERVRGFEWAAVVLVISGLTLVIQPWSLQGVLSVVLSLLSGFTWALAGIWLKCRQRRGPLNLISLTGWQLVMGSIPLLIVAIYYESEPIHWTLSFIGAAAYSAIPATAVAYLLFFYAMKSLPPGVAGMGTLLTPIVGVLAAWLQLGETPGALEVAGMGLIIAGLACISWENYRSSRAASS